MITLVPTCTIVPKTVPSIPKFLARAATEPDAAVKPSLNLLKPPSAPLVNALPKLARLFIASFVALSMLAFDDLLIAAASASAFCASFIPSANFIEPAAALATPSFM